MRHVAMRVLLVLGVAAAIALVSGTRAMADVTFAESAQEQLGVDAAGTPQPTDDAALGDAYRLFWEAPEGQRIHSLLTLHDEVEVVVEVLPADEVGSGDSAGKVYGTARVEERDDAGRPTRILVKVRNERTGGDDNFAETLWHEFRHAEIWVTGGGEDDHDDLDGEESERNERFRDDVERVHARLDVPLTSHTPNYDRIIAEGALFRDDAFGLAALFEQAEREQLSLEALVDEAEDLLDSVSSKEPTFTSAEIDITDYKALTLSYGTVEVDAVFNDSVFECGTADGTRRVVCPAGVLDMPPGEVHAVAMVLAAPVPQASTDHSYVFSAVFDSDLHAGNDWVFRPPYDWDLFRDTDRWYQLAWDHRTGTWSLSVTQLTSSGGIPGTPAPSSARVVIDTDTIVFFVPAAEFPAPRPAYRVTSFGHDGAYSESDRGADVSGVDPTVPPIPIPDGVLVVAGSDVAPEPVAEEAPEDFLAAFVDGLRGDVAFLVARINPATLAIYGEEQCRATLEGLVDPDAELSIRSVGAPGPWEYEIDGLTTTVDEALPVEVERVAGGQTFIQEVHWELVDGRWTWFTDCGEPLP